MARKKRTSKVPEPDPGELGIDRIADMLDRAERIWPTVTCRELVEICADAARKLANKAKIGADDE